MAQTPDEINAKAARGLLRARMALGGIPKAEFARRMREQSGGGPDDSTYGAWESGEHKIPLWAAVMASTLSGLSLEEILEQPPSPHYVRLEERVDRLTGSFEEMLKVLREREARRESTG